ncbi:cytochrome P450 [Mycena pura]|uniref:Cytochrome P450 n=1 Tax=Mycena pura TaxID=153505 RepID=A0AAD6V6N8_9AGAR|nr:cytochrome P450 [Mycena pura]
MNEIDTKTLAFYGLALALSVYCLRSAPVSGCISLLTHHIKKDESTIPAVIGGSGRISRCLASVQFLRNSTQVVAEGYCQHPTGVFRVPILFRDWFYLACGRKRVQEIASAPNNILSLDAALNEISMDYTLGKEQVHNTYHITSIRGGLTRSLDRCFPELRDEIEHAFDDVLALKGNEWKQIQIHDAILHIVTRASNRVFVGLPLCRNQEYLQLNIDFAVSVFARGQMISLFPEFLKPIFGPILSKRNSSLRHALKFLKVMIDERLEKDNQYGQDWPERPAFTNALYDLAKYPEYVEPMREEAELAIALKGWTKAALADMHKIDSFLRESQRFTVGFGIFGMVRKVVAKNGFAFSDGTHIPHGAIVGVPMIAVHRDPAFHPDPDRFDGFRFSRMREDVARAGHNDIEVGSEEKTTSGMFTRQMVSTTTDHIIFGHGRHACPGRFFAAMLLKAMLAHILINYDIKAEVEGVGLPHQGSPLFRSRTTDRKVWMKNREGL